MSIICSTAGSRVFEKFVTICICFFFIRNVVYVYICTYVNIVGITKWYSAHIYTLTYTNTRIYVDIFNKIPHFPSNC